VEIAEEQFARIKDSLPIQRGNMSLSNLQFLTAVLYVAEHGCKWRGLPKRFGNWHTIYTRMNRWSKNGVMDRIFEKLQLEQIVRIASSKKRTAVHRQVPRRMDLQDSYGCRG
jgi:transposase